MSGFPVDRGALAAFLLRAKRATTAEHPGRKSHHGDAESGTRQAEYREGDLVYRDSSYGFTFFSGDASVLYKDTLVWKMMYAGGVLDEFADSPALHTFLQEALARVTVERPFRGPACYERGACVYSDSTTGDVGGFYGVETVHLAGRRVYELRYHGGLVRIT